MVRKIWPGLLSVLLITLFVQNASAKKIRIPHNLSFKLPATFHSVSSATSSPSIVNAMDLPDIPALKQESGAYIDLGYNYKEKSWIGYIGSKTKYLKLSDEKLTEIMKLAGIKELPFVPFRNGMSRRATTETPTQLARRIRAEHLARINGFKPRRFDESQMQFQSRVFTQNIKNRYGLRGRLATETPAQYQTWVFAQERKIKAERRQKEKDDRGIITKAFSFLFGGIGTFFPLFVLAAMFYTLHRIKKALFLVVGGLFGGKKQSEPKTSSASYQQIHQPEPQQPITQEEAQLRSEIQQIMRNRAAQMSNENKVFSDQTSSRQTSYQTVTPQTISPQPTPAPSQTPLSYEDLQIINTYEAPSRKKKPTPKYSTVTKTAKIFGQSA